MRHSISIALSKIYRHTQTQTHTHIYDVYVCACTHMHALEILLVLFWVLGRGENQSVLPCTIFSVFFMFLFYLFV